MQISLSLLTGVVELIIARADELFLYPPLLVCDVTQYYHQAAAVAGSAPGSAASARRPGGTRGSGSVGRVRSGGTDGGGGSAVKIGRRVSITSSRSVSWVTRVSFDKIFIYLIFSFLVIENSMKLVNFVIY